MVNRHHPGTAPTALLQALAGGLCLTVDQLAAELDLTKRQVSDAASRLLRRDYLERMAIGCYQLTPAGLDAAAAGEVIRSGRTGSKAKVREVRDSLRQRAWTSMRIQRLFTIPDLVIDAARLDDRNPEDNLQRYLRALAQAGIVAVSPHRVPGTAPTSNGHKRYLLKRDSGPRAPAVRARTSVIHDFNTGEDVPCAPR